MRKRKTYAKSLGSWAPQGRQLGDERLEVLVLLVALGEFPRVVLALLKYPFYPLFNFDNGMNLISKSLTILTSGQLLVVFTFAHIFWRYFVFAGF